MGFRPRRFVLADDLEPEEVEELVGRRETHVTATSDEFAEGMIVDAGRLG
jgi:hypothetical protein